MATNKIIVQGAVQHLAGDDIDGFVDLMYDGVPKDFRIVLHENFKPNHPTVRGEVTMKRDHVLIEVYLPCIREGFRNRRPIGGNSTVAKTFKHGIFLNLAHELRHAHQALYHSQADAFWNGKKYMSNPAEVDARRHVDQNELVIKDFLGL